MSPEPPRRKPLGMVTAEPNVSRAPHTPVPPALPLRDAVSTAPPPAMPMAPPRGMQGPRTHERRRFEPVDESTLVGLGPLPAPRRRLDTGEVSSEDQLSRLAAEESIEAQRRKAAIHSAVIKVLLALAGTLGAVTTYLAVHSATVLPPRVDNTEARTKVVETATTTDHEQQLKILEYLRAEQARRDCLDGQIGSALARGTGHRISSSDDSASWVESSMPTRRPSLLWDRAVFYPASPCAAEPRVP